MISSVRLDGSTACMAIDGATTGEVFRENVRHVLSPTLRPGDIVVMDNLLAHKDAEAINLINGAGAVIRFQPSYNPGFNPIEKMWSKVEEFLRAAKARTQEALFHALAAALKTVTPEDGSPHGAMCHLIAKRLWGGSADVLNSVGATGGRQCPHT